MTGGLSDLILLHVKSNKVILCEEVRESHSLYVHICVFVYPFGKCF